ncbi:V-type ATP synthase subunit E family protein [Marispirochaeta aestuarii]|uniref:V-type ATP synthase subunit E n=1 Tax=Marispirochaeta aestuarii TaxID=1963862 RepID=UPI0029C7C1CD|nr:V-type ATP synthase subunit E family protein [Marispirochaeta aestuarii]
MRDNSADTGLPILDGILGEAGVEAERIRSEAEQKAEELKQSTENQCRRILEEARQRAEAQRRSVLKAGETAVAAELRRIELRARERLNEELLEQLRKRLLQLEQSPGYRDICRELIAEAAEGIGTAKVLVCVPSSGKGRIDRELLAEAQELLSRRGLKTALELQEDDTATGPGIVCRDPSGRMVFDNRFEARMRRLRRELVRIIAGEIEGKDGKTS